MSGPMNGISQGMAVLFSAALGIATVTQAFASNATMTATCGALTIFSLLVSQLHRVKSVSGFGIEAQIRRLDSAIGEADETLERLRQLAALFSKLIVDTQARAGRTGGPIFRDRCETAREVRKLLGEVGAPIGAIREAMLPWANWMVLDLAYGIINRIQKLLSSEFSRSTNGLPHGDQARIEVQRQVSEFKRDYLNNPYFTSPDIYPERLYEIARAMPLITEQVRSEIIGVIDEFAPQIRSIRVEQAIPDDSSQLADLEKIARHPPPGDPLNWRATPVRGDGSY